MEHFGDAAWFPRAVVTHNEVCSLALDPFMWVDVCLVVGVPYDGFILKGGSDWGQVGCATAVLGAVFQIPSKETKSGIGSFGDVVGVCVPLEV